MSQNMNIASEEPVRKANKILNVSEEQQVQIFAKQMLAKRIFVGNYQERRYVEALKSYRDIVCVSDTEDDLPRDLNIVKKRLQQLYPSHIIWTGITGQDMSGAPAGVCLWVKLNSIPFGYYWFQIREVKIIENLEICIRLKCLRSVNPIGGLVNSTTANSKDQSGSCELPQDETHAKKESNEITSAFDIQKVINDIKNIKYSELIMTWLSMLSVVLTLKNMQQAMTFLVILLAATVTGFFKLVAHIGDFSLRAMREISVFMHTCTPLLLGIIDFFTKCVGGILILITVMWRGSPPQNAFQQVYRPAQALPPPPANFNGQSYPTRRHNNRYSHPS